MPTEEEKEAFLSRWSRLKQEKRNQPPQEAGSGATDAQGPPPELPPLDKLTYDSDYRVFLDARVDEDTRRAALKTLFADARFNVIDPMDIYIDDYTKADPIPAAMLATLRQAQNVLEWAREDREARERAARREPEIPPAALASGTDTPVPVDVTASPDPAAVPAAQALNSTES